MNQKCEFKAVSVGHSLYCNIEKWLCHPTHRVKLMLSDVPNDLVSEIVDAMNEAYNSGYYDALDNVRRNQLCT